MQPHADAAPRPGRPRTVSDRDLIDAFLRVHLDGDPARWTLADVARDAGVVPATIVQRFGSKRGLMERALQQGLADLEIGVAAAVERAPDDWRAGLDGVIAVLVPQDLSPRQMANSIAQLYVELSDPGLRPWVERHMTVAAAAFETVLAWGGRGGDLRDAPGIALGEVATTAWSGAVVRFAITGSGSSRAWVTRAVEEVLAPYLNRST
ncbi:MAG: TetR/AcrR family transcriptional regulator [Thermomicrobiales bacterium]